MTHTDDASTYADLLARLGDDGTKELFRRLLEEALQELIDAELTAQIRHLRACALRIIPRGEADRRSRVSDPA